MLEHKPVQIVYRGSAYAGVWWVEVALVHVTSQYGSKSASIVFGRGVPLPYETAQRLLLDLVKATSPKRSFWSWFS